MNWLKTWLLLFMILPNPVFNQNNKGRSQFLAIRAYFTCDLTIHFCKHDRAQIYSQRNIFIGIFLENMNLDLNNHHRIKKCQVNLFPLSNNCESNLSDANFRTLKLKFTSLAWMGRRWTIYSIGYLNIFCLHELLF